MGQLKAFNLTKSFGKKKVLEDISLAVSSGEVVGLLGPNGAGKTTTFKILLGFIHPDQGAVYLDDQEITHYPIFRRAWEGIIYLPQEPSIFRPLSVINNVKAILELRQPDEDIEKKALQVLEEMDVAHLKDQRAENLSGGERRRVEIARALSLDPAFLLLDEPFAGIDPLAVQDVQRVIFHLKQKGIGVLITDHNVRETLKITERAYIIKDGRIFRSGTPHQLAQDQEVRRSYLGEAFSL